MVELSVQCENKTSEEAWERMKEAISNLSGAFRELIPEFEKAVGNIEKFVYYTPIPVEGSVE